MYPLAKEWERKTGIPAEYFLAVNASESNWGRAPGNMLFGIKSTGGKSTGPLDTWEAGQGATTASFAAYDSPDQAYAAFVDLISTSPRYQKAWQQFQHDHNPDALFAGLNAAGYATDPAWGSKISSLSRSIGSQTPTDPGAQNTGYTFPVQGFTGKVEPHWGTDNGGADIFAPAGSPVVAMVGGKVTWLSGDDGSNLAGNAVEIHGDDGLDYYYAHTAEAPPFRMGQQVNQGDLVGHVGDTGNARNRGLQPLLHIGIGHGIAVGGGSHGGMGNDFDAVSFLNGTLGSNAAPSSPGPTRASANDSSSTAQQWFTVAEGGLEMLVLHGPNGMQHFQVGATDQPDGTIIDPGTTADTAQLSVGAGQDASGDGDSNQVDPLEVQRLSRGADLGYTVLPPVAAAPPPPAPIAHVQDVKEDRSYPAPSTSLAETPAARTHYAARVVNALPDAPAFERQQVESDESTPASRDRGQRELRNYYTYADGGNEVLVTHWDDGTQYHQVGSTDQPDGTVIDSGTLLADQPVPATQQIQVGAAHQQQIEDMRDTRALQAQPPQLAPGQFQLTDAQRAQVARGVTPASPATPSQPTIGGPAGAAMDVLGGTLPPMNLPQPEPGTPLARSLQGQQLTGPEQVVAGGQTLGGYEQAREQATQALNPLRDVPVVGGAINQATDPLTYLPTGAIDRAAGAVLGRVAGPAARAIAPAARAVAPAIGRVASAPLRAIDAGAGAVSRALPAAVGAVADTAGGTLQRGVEHAGEVVAHLPLPGALQAGTGICSRAPAVASTQFAIDVAGAAMGGAETAAQTDPADPNRLAKIAAGALAGGAGAHAAVEWTPTILRATRELLAPVYNLPAPVQQSVIRLAHGENGATEAGKLWRLRIEDVLGKSGTSSNTRDAASLFEAGHDFSTTPTPAMRQLAQDMHDFGQKTGAEGRTLGYISGDVVKRSALGKVARYFPHVHEQPLANATKVARQRSLSAWDFYSNERKFETLQDAVRAGWAPVNSVSDPFGHYASHVLSSRARAQFITDLKALKNAAGIDVIRNGSGNAARRMPSDWEWGGRILPRDPNFQNVWLSPEMATVVRNITNPSFVSSNKWLRAGADLMADAKRALFEASGFHWFTEVGQAINVGGVRGVPMIAKATLHTLFPDTWRAFQLRNIDMIQRAADAGLTLNFGGQARDVGGQLGSRFGGLARRSAITGAAGAGFGYAQSKQAGASDEEALRQDLIGGAVGAAFGGLVAPVTSKALWDRAVPSLKLQTFSLLADKVGPKVAAEYSNEVFGGQNLAAIARSPNVQSALRTAILSPDWWEGWTRQIGNALRPGPLGDVNREYWRNAAIGAAFTLEGLNWALSGGPNGGHFTNQNEPGHQFELEATHLYDLLGWDRRDPKTGQPMRVYADILGPIRSMLELGVAAAKAGAGQYGQGVLPGIGDGFADTAGKFAQARIGLVPRGVGEIASGLDYRGQPIVPPGTAPPQAAALRVGHLLSNLAPVTASQFQQEAGRFGGVPAAVASITGRRLSYETPLSQAFKQTDDAFKALGGLPEKQQQAQQQRNQLRDQADRQLVQLYSNPGSLTHAQIEQQVIRLGEQVPTLPDLYSSLVPDAPAEAIDFLRTNTLSVPGSSAPADLPPDKSSSLDAISDQYWRPKPADVMAHLSATQQAALRRQALVDAAKQLDVDPDALLDAIKAKAWGVRLPPTGGATAAEVSDWVQQYVDVGKGEADPQARADARWQLVTRIAGQHPGLTPDAVSQRISLRLRPAVGNVPEPMQSQERATQMLQRRFPKYANPDGSPVQNVVPATADAMLAAATTAEKRSNPQLHALQQAAEQGKAARLQYLLLNSANRDDYERWYGLGRNMTDKDWQQYLSTPETHYSDSPSRSEAQHRDQVVRMYRSATPVQKTQVKVEWTDPATGAIRQVPLALAYRDYNHLFDKKWRDKVSNDLPDPAEVDSTP